MVKEEKSGGQGGRLQRQATKDRPSTAELLGLKPVSENPKNEASTAERTKSKTSERVRVWWPPTKDKKKSGFSGAYWEAAVLKKSSNRYEVEYDNGDTEKVSHEHIFPADVPAAFGKDANPPIQVGEFVEVSNDSETDPAAWLGVVSDKQGSSFQVSYPFHDSPTETIKPSLIRRARVWDNKTWRFIQTGQTWEAGEVTSPKELCLLKEKEYFQQLKAEAAGPSSKGAAKRKKAAPKQEEASEGESAEEEEEEQPEEAPAKKTSGSESQQGASKRKPGRGRKPVVAKREEPSTEDRAAARKRGRHPKVKPSNGAEEPSSKKRKADVSSKAMMGMGPAGAGAFRTSGPLILAPPSKGPPGTPLTTTGLTAALHFLAQGVPTVPLPSPLQLASTAVPLLPSAPTVAAGQQAPQMLAGGLPLAAALATLQAASAAPREPAGTASAALQQLSAQFAAAAAAPAGSLMQPTATAAPLVPGLPAAVVGQQPMVPPQYWAGNARAVAPSAQGPSGSGLLAGQQQQRQQAGPEMPSTPPRSPSASTGTGAAAASGGGAAAAAAVGAMAIAAGLGQAAVGWPPGSKVVQLAPRQVQLPGEQGYAHSVVVVPGVEGAAGDLAKPSYWLVPDQTQAPVQAPAQAPVQQPDMGTTASQPEPAKEQKKRKKDPNAPKKPATAYSMYHSLNRANVVAANPTLGKHDVTRLLSTMWQGASPEEKQEAEAAAAADKERYNKEVADYVPVVQGGEDADEPAPKRRYKKDPAAPKKPHTAYIQFLMDYRKSLPVGTHVVEGTAQTAAAWHALSKEERAVYEQQAAAAKEAWEKEKQAYEASKAAKLKPPKLTGEAALQLMGPAALRNMSSGAISSVAPAALLNSSSTGAGVPNALATALANAAAQVAMPVSAPLWPAAVQQRGDLQLQQLGLAMAAVTSTPALAAAQQRGVSPGSVSTAAAASSERRTGRVSAGLEEAGGGDDSMLAALDMPAVKQLLAAIYKPHAYLMLVDVLRQDSPRFQHAMNAIRMFVHGHETPDWHACMVNIFGLEQIAGLIA